MLEDAKQHDARVARNHGLRDFYTGRGETDKVAHLKLCNAPAQIYNVLRITGFLQNISMYESLDMALDSFGKE